MRKAVSMVTIFVLLASMFLAAAPTSASVPPLPDYQPVDWQSGLAGKVEMPEVTVEGSTYQEIGQIASTPSVGTKAYDWYLRAISRNTPTGTQPWMTLRAISGNVEVWTQDYLWFLPSDPRNADPYNLMISDEMCQYLADEFNNVIYPRDTTYFAQPFDRNGTNTIFEQYGYPSYYWDWIATDNPQRVILKILNIRDRNYIDPTYPYYTGGFYSPTYTRDYYNRNMIHIDAWRWWQRLGAEGRQWFPERPDLVVTRPYLYEATTTHEYQHNIHRDWNPADDLFMNEGLSMYAELICDYGIDPSYLNSYLYTPDNSLTIWGDQGDINILADYGAAALWAVYLSDHYGGAALLHYFLVNGVPGIEGVNAALAHFGYVQMFDDVYHDWRIANLIRSDKTGGGKYNYKSLNLNDPAIIPAFTHPIGGLPIPWTEGTDYGNTYTILGYDTGVSKIGPYGSDYTNMTGWNKMGIVYFDGDDTTEFGWTMTADGWWSGTGEDLIDTLLYGEAEITAVDPTLTIVTKYRIEPLWDFGFVQISTDGGNTWTSLSNAYTTSNHDPAAHPNIVANLPGLTDNNTGDWPGWTTMDFDLSAYAGQAVLIGFRYMTDWATTEEGWWIQSATVSGTELTLTPVYPEADFQVSIVHAFKNGAAWSYIVNDINLQDSTETGNKGLQLAKYGYAILVVSYISHVGWVDYSFSAKSPPIHGP